MDETTNETDVDFKSKMVKYLDYQQEALKNNLQLQIANLIVGILLFIMLIVVMVLK